MASNGDGAQKSRISAVEAGGPEPRLTDAGGGADDVRVLRER
jgi:hypothetical protein